MIYINNSETAQMISIPATAKKVDGGLTFILRSTVDNTEPVNLSVTQTGQSDLYYMFSLALPNKLQEGEYEYVLKKSDDVLECGLAMVGQGTGKEEYNTNTEYEQYEG